MRRKEESNSLSRDVGSRRLVRWPVALASDLRHLTLAALFVGTLLLALFVWPHMEEW